MNNGAGEHIMYNGVSEHIMYTGVSEHIMYSAVIVSKFMNRTCYLSILLIKECDVNPLIAPRYLRAMPFMCIKSFLFDRSDC